jgi:alpha-mannosidase
VRPLNDSFHPIVSQYGYGVAILNDCKYGYAVEGNVMRLSLLRAPTLPDANADQGRHEFAFAILLHASSFEESAVFEAAEAFNAPLRREWRRVRTEDRAASSTEGVFNQIRL